MSFITQQSSQTDPANAPVDLQQVPSVIYAGVPATFNITNWDSFTTYTVTTTNGTVSQSNGVVTYTPASAGNAGFTINGRIISLTAYIITPEYLVVGGGAGAGGGTSTGGGTGAGGGGAGGVLTGTFTISIGVAYTVTVGAGGAGGTTGVGSNGTSSQFASFVAAGGGGGGAGTGLSPQAGVSGGSGGGGGASWSPNPAIGGAAGSGNTPATTPSQGNSGGAGDNGRRSGGGGGGAVSQGLSAFALPSGAFPGWDGTIGGVARSIDGPGGFGLITNIRGFTESFGGGGGSGSTYISLGGWGGGTWETNLKGGGGDGYSNNNASYTPYFAPNGSAGTANTGGGGGAGVGGATPTGLAGGSGVVIIAYSSLLPAIASIGAGLTYSVSTTSRPGYRVYTFTAGTGTITWS